MKLLILLLLFGCSGFTTSKSMCDNKVGVQQQECLEAYEEYVRHLNYREFRGGDSYLRGY